MTKETASTQLRRYKFKLFGKEFETFKALDIINKIPTSVEKYELLAKYYSKTNRKENAIQLYKELNQQLKSTQYNEQINQLINE